MHREKFRHPGDPEEKENVKAAEAEKEKEKEKPVAKRKAADDEDVSEATADGKRQKVEEKDIGDSTASEYDENEEEELEPDDEVLLPASPVDIKENIKMKLLLDMPKVKQGTYSLICA